MDLFIDQSIKWNPTQQKYIDDDGYPADFKFTNASLRSKQTATTFSDTIDLNATSSVNINAPVYSNMGLFRAVYTSSTPLSVLHDNQTDVSFDQTNLVNGTAIILRVAGSQFKNITSKPIMLMVNVTATTPNATELPAGTIINAAIRHMNASGGIVGMFGENATTSVNQTNSANLNVNTTLFLAPNEYFIYTIKINLGGGGSTTLAGGPINTPPDIGRALIIQQIG